MTWFKVDDSFYRSRKVRRLGRDRVAAVGLWTLCGDWSADNLTDGFVPWEVVEEWDAKRRLAHRLIAVALWHEAEADGEEGVQFHDWHDWQPTKDQVIQRRKADAERRARWREARRNASKPAGPDTASPDTSLAESRRDADVSSRGASRSGSVLPDPTRPDPTRTSFGSTTQQDGTTSRTAAAARTPNPANDAAFDAFWAAYPRRKDKQEARKAFDAVLRRKVDPARLVAAAKAYAATEPDERYVKYPATWLRAGSYDNEPDQPRQLRAVSGGYQPFRNPADQSVYDEPLLPVPQGRQEDHHG